MTTNTDVEYDDPSDGDDGVNHFRRDHLTLKRIKRESVVLRSKRNDLKNEPVRSRTGLGEINTNLRNTNVHETNIPNTNIHTNNISSTNNTKTNIQNTNIHPNNNIQNANITKTNIQNTNNNNIHSANIAKTNIPNTKIHPNNNIQNANITKTNIPNTKIHPNKNIQNANITKTNIPNTNIHPNNNIQNANITKTSIQNTNNNNIHSANTKTNIQNTKMHPNNNIQNANITKTNIQNTNVHNANIEKTNTQHNTSVENLRSHFQNIIHLNKEESVARVSPTRRNLNADSAESKARDVSRDRCGGLVAPSENQKRDNPAGGKTDAWRSKALGKKSQELSPSGPDGGEHQARGGGRNNFIFNRGADPRIATCRGKLQTKRSKLNQEINKELRLRAGAENLFKATTNRKLKETVALELSFVNSNLQLLKEQLAELNSSVELYQNDIKEPVMPMIPLGLKETKEIDVREPFKDFILEHYSEDGAAYEAAILEFMDMRQAMRTPHRDNSGISLLFQYYNQLYFIERRFFPPDRSLGIYFEWYDSLTGVPSCQRTTAFEKACVLFNMAAIYTQMAAKQDRLTSTGLDQAVDNFLRATGTFKYVQENFTNAPSMDLGPAMLDMLIQLMLSQARECLFQKLQLQATDKSDFQYMLELAQEAAQVAEMHTTLLSLITIPEVKDYVPFSWISLIQVKREHYLALSHYYCASGLLTKTVANLSSSAQNILSYIYVSHENKKKPLLEFEPSDESKWKQLGVAHLKSALLLHEESQRIFRMCRELRNKQALFQVLVQANTLTLEMYAEVEEEDDLNTMYEAPDITPSTKFQLTLTPPDFAHLPVEDLFKQLGPVAIFSAKHHWSAPRSIQLQRGSGPDGGFGFSVRGDAPVIVASVDSGSLAQFGGMKEGDFIVSICSRDVKWSPHEQVVQIIKDAGKCLRLKLVTPLHKHGSESHSLASSRSKGTESVSAESRSSDKTQSPSSSVAPSRKQIWNPFKKSSHRDHAEGYTHIMSGS